MLPQPTNPQRHSIPADADAIIRHSAESRDIAPLVALFEQGFDPNTFDRFGLAPLHRAAQFDNQEMAIALLRAGAEVNLFSSQNTTPLMGVSSGAMARLLLDAGADIDVKTIYTKWRTLGNETALISTSSMGHIDVVRVLLERGADHRFHDNSGRSALTRALQNEHDNVARLLIEHGAEINLIEAALLGDTAEVLKRLPTENSPHLMGRALRWAAGRGRTEVVQLLLDHGVDIDSAEERGQTALMNAIQGQRSNTIRLLIACGANLNEKLIAPDCCSWPPLMATIIFGTIEIASWLLEAGADPNIFTDANIDYASNNALMLAISGGKVEMVKLLLRYGAAIDARSSDGESALSFIKGLPRSRWQFRQFPDAMEEIRALLEAKA